MALFPYNKFSSVSISSDVETQSTESKDGTQIVRQSKKHKFKFKVTTIPMKPNSLEAREIAGFFNGLGGRFGMFEMVLPEYSSCWNSFVYQNPELSGAHEAGTTQLALVGLPNNMPNALVSGDFVKIRNKAYMVKESINTGTGGSATVSIYPPLRDDVPNSSTCVIKDIPFQVCLASDVTKIERVGAATVQYSFELEEAWR